jgi:hypothetical protein
MKRRPGAIPGRLLLCFIRKGVLQAFYGLLLFGGILILPPYIKRRAGRSNGVCGGVMV